jgi:hypothetical protein
MSILHCSITNSNVVARQVLALSAEAIPSYEKAASAKTKSASQRHYSHGL